MAVYESNLWFVLSEMMMEEERRWKEESLYCSINGSDYESHEGRPPNSCRKISRSALGHPNDTADRAHRCSVCPAAVLSIAASLCRPLASVQFDTRWESWLWPLLCSGQSSLASISRLTFGSRLWNYRSGDALGQSTKLAYSFVWEVIATLAAGCALWGTCASIFIRILFTTMYSRIWCHLL